MKVKELSPTNGPLMFKWPMGPSEVAQEVIWNVTPSTDIYTHPQHAGVPFSSLRLKEPNEGQGVESN